MAKKINQKVNQKERKQKGEKGVAKRVSKNVGIRIKLIFPITFLGMVLDDMERETVYHKNITELALEYMSKWDRKEIFEIKSLSKELI